MNSMGFPPNVCTLASVYVWYVYYSFALIVWTIGLMTVWSAYFQHILDTVLLTFILRSESSFLHCIWNILRLLSLSLCIVSDDYVLLVLVYHFIYLRNDLHAMGLFQHYYSDNNNVNCFRHVDVSAVHAGHTVCHNV